MISLLLQIVTYTADDDGYHATVEYEGEPHYDQPQHQPTYHHEPAPYHQELYHPEPAPYHAEPVKYHHVPKPYHEDPAPYGPKPQVYHPNTIVHASEPYQPKYQPTLYHPTPAPAPHGPLGRYGVRPQHHKPAHKYSYNPISTPAPIHKPPNTHAPIHKPSYTPTPAPVHHYAYSPTPLPYPSGPRVFRPHPTPPPHPVAHKPVQYKSKIVYEKPAVSVAVVKSMPSRLPAFTPNPLESFSGRPAITLDPEEIKLRQDLDNHL